MTLGYFITIFYTPFPKGKGQFFNKNGSPKGVFVQQLFEREKMTKMNSYYFKEIEKIPLISHEEEKSLAAKAFSGDKKAQKKLVEANLRFVVKIANQYQGYMDVEDLIMEGNMGLMHAAEKFNPENGNRFSTYAVFWIRCYIQKAIRETSTGIKFPATKYKEMKNLKWNIASLDKVISNSDDEEVTLGSFVKDKRNLNPETEFYKKETSEKLVQSINSLGQKERYILINRYGLNGKDPMSLSELGKVKGYSKERIRQIEKHALAELRKNLDGSDKTAYLAA